jgi:type I restriction enzyme S subunit
MSCGWEIKNLSEICTNLDSKRIPITQNKRKKGDIPYYGASGIVDYVEEYLFDEDLLLVSEDGANLLMRTYPIAFSITGKTWVNNHAHVLRFPNRISQRFVEYYLNSIKLDDYVSGMAQPKLNQGMLNSIPIPFPPLQEQKHILEILDGAFAAIDKAKANVEKNLLNAKELFESYLQNVFENKSEDWEVRKLGEIANVEYGFTDKAISTGEYRYIRITDINKNGELILQDKVYIKKSKEAECFLAKNNDLLMARTGATYAKVLLYKDYEPSVFASYLIRISFTEVIENELYWYFTKTKDYWQQANILSSGAAQPQFNGAAVKEIIFPYPKSSHEQKDIVKRFKALSVEKYKLGNVYQRKLNNLEELRKSILQKAFSGELTTKEPAI